MKKFAYKLNYYQFNVEGNLVPNVESTFNEEGACGWELVDWKFVSTFTDAQLKEHCPIEMIKIIATWKKEVEL